MAPDRQSRARRLDGVDSPPRTGKTVDSRSLILRNYDGNTGHELHVLFVDASGETALSRTFTLAPTETATVRTRLKRAVYRIEVQLDDENTASAECLIGSGFDETALIETGNGTVSVVEGVV